MKKILLLVLLLMPVPGYTGGIPVYSALEHSQSLMTHIEVLNDAMVQLDKLGVMNNQLLTEMEGLVVQYNQFEQQIRNAQALQRDFTNLANADYTNILDRILSVKNRVEQLDPTNPAYVDVMRSDIDQRYDWKPVQSEALNDNVYGAESVTREYEQRYMPKRQRYEQNLTARSANNMLAKDRAKKINDYEMDLNDLGDNSSLQTQQLTASQINLMLLQQEELIKRIDDINRREEEKEMQQAAEQRKVHDQWVERVNAVRNRKPLGTHLN